jgi:putative transposase
MREDKLLAIRQRKFVVTTDSGHHFGVYPNLAQYLELNDINQLWVADITYVRLQAEFVYLAVVLDAHSRWVIGWALSRSMNSGLTVEALEIQAGCSGTNVYPHIGYGSKPGRSCSLES